MKKITTLLLISCLLLQSCEMIEYHPYDGRISGETGINQKNIERIETACAEKSTIRFILISDTQRWYDETEDVVKLINKRNDIDFVIHGGDISDFGLTKEFMWQRDILNKLTVPYVVLLGNHDCLANGIEIFEKVFGEVNFSFIAGRTKFVCLNTNALEFDYSYPVPDFKFIEQEMVSRKDDFDKTVMAMHVRPFSDQFNDNVANVFQRYIKEFPKLQFCLHGHNHSLEENDLFEDGIIYYGISNIAKRKYYVFTLKPDDTYDYEVVEF
ncbi:3',5'-cyclic AMP phosphodiesterase CpdA [Dysgonomonas hofstadii]|uniref:3',5'-cyclic AMP phosphodiesterase CpdA n=1 Tax=Dysgonomonas hofstadii TaxID=637886 RepID=A0A840CRD2_9BACT|nr:metallophosphoesterase [Dysgonomonas hofstadii]MBB4036708.1 3',5'-cyclic AMP phosphodiesterase CpdA [Dysgonomonas hofstadii]